MVMVQLSRSIVNGDWEIMQPDESIKIMMELQTGLPDVRNGRRPKLLRLAAKFGQSNKMLNDSQILANCVQ